MANQFFNFSPEAFEQFARALALSVFGPGVTVFGNGPDGGREASFRGTVPYPFPPTEQWAGYGVIQAKCKEKTESTEKDQNWALNELKKELKKFAAAKRNPKPNYYVFVTNVELSSVQGGGRDQADALVRSCRADLALDGYAIWDANQLNGFLAKDEGMRRNFTAYLTPGDVLATLIDQLNRCKPNLTHILSTFLERELRADEAPRLDQAGSRTEEQLRLAHLFIDLPSAPDPKLDPPKESANDGGQLPAGVLVELLCAGSRKMDPKTVHQQEIGVQQNTTERYPTRFVLLGGPGSGKSTVSQFLAQIHRSALLERRDPHLLDPATLQIIAHTRAACERENLPWPKTPRYPFKIELNRFAKALASRDSTAVTTLERYILNSVRREHDLSHQDLLAWLAVCPCLLIFDGLDEVPQTSNRREVIEAINGFLSELRQAEADYFVVATSRHQGYDQEFATGNVAFRHVLPLSPARALRYVEKYADSRFGKSNPQRALDVVEKLRDATRRDLTAQLMTSPLQVTFMATVVAASGEPGEDRWQLFAGYYRTVYDRERQKAVPPYDSVLTKQQPTIDRLHHDVGFLLQFRGETEGANGLGLPMDQFRQLVEGYLTEVGRYGKERDDLVRLITEAASHRLVFLTSRVPHELSFDVRSLQEYMAAECLMTGTLETVQARLNAVASSSFWRNVFLFATSKCFADAQSRHFQDSIRLLCQDLNSTGDPVLDTLRTGSELAIDILQSGAVAENPNYARHLAQLAFGLVTDSYPDKADPQGIAVAQKLAAIYNNTLQSVFEPELRIRVSNANVKAALGAWTLLIRLIKRGAEWALELADRSWPVDPRAQDDLILSIPPDLMSMPWVLPKVERTIWRVPPSRLTGLIPEDLASLSTEIRSALFLLRDDFPSPTARFTVLKEFSICYGSLWRDDINESNRIPVEKCIDSAWLPEWAAAEFARSPSHETLNMVLNILADRGWRFSDRWSLELLPWPLANCLLATERDIDLRALAAVVGAGTLGDLRSWSETERSWVANGIAIQTLTTIPDAGLSVDARGHLSIPSQFGLMLWASDETTPDVEFLLDAAWRANSRHVADALIYACLFLGGARAQCSDQRAFGELAARTTSSIWFYAEPGSSSLSAAWLETFDTLGRKARVEVDSPEQIREWTRCFELAFLRRRQGTPGFGLGLLRLLGEMAVVGIPIELVGPEMAKQNLLEEVLHSEPIYGLAAVLVALTNHRLDESRAIRLAQVTNQLLERAGALESDFLERIFSTADNHIQSVAAITHYLIKLRETLLKRSDLNVGRCDRILKKNLRSRKSDLHGDGRLESLRLPLLAVA